MATESLNIKLDYNQVLELARQLSEEEKERLKDELIAESNKAKLKHFQNLFSCEESEQMSMEEIQAEINELRRERQCKMECSHNVRYEQENLLCE